MIGKHVPAHSFNQDKKSSFLRKLVIKLTREMTQKLL